MGNCIKKEQAMQWGGEDWASLAPCSDDHDHDHDHDGVIGEEKGLLKHTFSASSLSYSSSSEKTATPTTEVKVKITKKQLEELLGKTDFQGLSVQQVLAQLIKVSDGYESHQRSWRPALQSIPEAN